PEKGNSYAVHAQLMVIQDPGLKPMFLIDEIPMISGTMLTALSNTLQGAGDVDSVVGFGKYLVIIFWDFGLKLNAFRSSVAPALKLQRPVELR
ncbi:hypothetical protein BGZ49_007467, partial [Haplosporangium sp. Z 27]